MKVNELQPGDKVDIRILHEVNNAAEDAVIHNYYSSVFDVTDKGLIIINMPVQGSKMVLLNEGVRYEFVFNSTKNQSMYKAEGEVVKRFKKENFLLLAILLNTELVRFQRREYYRLNCMMPVVFQTIDKELASMGSIKQIEEVLKLESGTMRVRGLGTILDISGGGLRFTTTSDFKDVEYIIVQFTLANENKEYGVINAVALKVHSSYRESVGKYEHRMKFIFKDPRDRELIIKYIFDEERMLRKKDQG